MNQRCVTVAGNSIFFLDKNGIFQYQGGEPVMVSVPLLDFFGDHVDQDNIDKAFLLHNKEDETIMAFVPSSGSSWCDRCVILDLRKGVFTVDIVPQVTCGFVDGPDVYLGGRFGAILKYNKTTYADYVTPVTGTCTVSGTAVTLTTGYLEEDGSYLGAPVILVDATNLRIWRSNITGYENDSMTIETPTPLFNASGVSASGSLTYYIGHMFLYDKSSQLAFPPAEAMYEKVLREVQYMANTFANADELMNKLDMDADGSNTLVSELEVEGVLARCDVLNGMHKSFVCELALVTDSEFALRNSAYFVESRQGRVQD